MKKHYYNNINQDSHKNAWWEDNENSVHSLMLYILIQTNNAFVSGTRS